MQVDLFYVMLTSHSLDRLAKHRGSTCSSCQFQPQQCDRNTVICVVIDFPSSAGGGVLTTNRGVRRKEVKVDVC